MATLTFGSLYWAVPAPTILVTDVPAKAAGTTVAMQLAGFTHSNNRLTNTGVMRVYEVQFNGSIHRASGGTQGAAQILSGLYKNSEHVAGAGSVRTVSNLSDNGSFSILAQMELDTSDYVELWVQSDNGDDLQIEVGVLSVKVLG
jgi:hypothetical protein